MNRRMPRTAGIDQLSLNLSVTRSPGSSFLVSILVWPLRGLGGRITTGGFFLFSECLEVVRGMAQCGGPALAALGGLCEGCSLLTEVTGTSVGGAADLVVVVGPGCVVVAGPSAVPDAAELVLVAPLPLGPLVVVRGEVGLLGSGTDAFPILGRVVRCSPLPLCSSENRLMASSCSSGALSGSWRITMYRFVRKLV